MSRRKCATQEESRQATENRILNAMIDYRVRLEYLLPLLHPTTQGYVRRAIRDLGQASVMENNYLKQQRGIRNKLTATSNELS